MSRENSQWGPTLSILDRLTEKQTPASSWDEMREIKRSLCDDLAALLNTRRAEEDFDEQYEQAANSVLTYGVTDFTSYNLTNTIEQERLRRSIERAIRLFEPRLTRVNVILEDPDPLRPVLRFQIEAVLRTETPGEPVLFDAMLYRDSRRISVSGANS
jgi:type VI secretion system protein ImpF